MTTKIDRMAKSQANQHASAENCNEDPSDNWILWRPPRHPVLLTALLLVFIAWVAFLFWMGQN